MTFRLTRVKPVITFSLLTIGIPAFAQGTDPAVGEIVSHLRSGDAQGALTLAQARIKQEPDSCQVLSLEAVAYTGLSKTDDALKSFQAALRHCPAYLPALEGAAQIGFQRHSMSAAPLLLRILEVQPGNLPAHGMLASLYAGAGECSKAIPHFAASTALLTSQPSARESYGRCLAFTGDLPGAIEQFRQVVAANPTDANQCDLADIQWRNREPANAMTTLAPLLGAKTYSPAFSLAANIAESQGDTPRAVELLRQAILLAPEDQGNYIDFANLAFAHNSFQVGIDMLNAGLQRNPTAATLYLARGILEMQLTKQQEAVADFEKAHQLDPKLSLSMDALGIARSQQHDDTASLAIYREQARQHPQDALLHYLLAEQLSENESAGSPAAAEAITAAKRSVELDSGYAPARVLLAKLYLSANKPELAMQEAAAVLARSPEDESALYQAMMASRRLGRKADVQSFANRLRDARQHASEKQQKGGYQLTENSAP
ncbi:tetratricopeptide repeat protein [Silvibacterium acidisoli]|uniref:tetratricopeptide repeat protein n=1 Tax=Acidobacteriaceae bacterium ZG23-2 TaxID=2883246 RepID=UPI00406BFF79